MEVELRLFSNWLWVTENYLEKRIQLTLELSSHHNLEQDKGRIADANRDREPAWRESDETSPLDGWNELRRHHFSRARCGWKPYIYIYISRRMINYLLVQAFGCVTCGAFFWPIGRGFSAATRRWCPSTVRPESRPSSGLLSGRARCWGISKRTGIGGYRWICFFFFSILSRGFIVATVL